MKRQHLARSILTVIGLIAIGLMAGIVISLNLHAPNFFAPSPFGD